MEMEIAGRIETIVIMIASVVRASVVLKRALAITELISNNNMN